MVWYHFYSVPQGGGICRELYAVSAAQLPESSNEDEGFSLILPRSEADRLGLSYDMRMRQITLMVFSALEGVGLTAAVAETLEKEGIPTNIVAATLHDHVFVPSNRSDEAMKALRALQMKAQLSGSV